ncbi:MAG: DUF4105 domain-containing protein [Bacteriovoracaceae bacterium]
MAGLMPAILFSKDQDWLSLYYYEKTLLGGYNSLVDSPEFFFHPDGKYSPNKELQAAVEAFKKIEKSYTAAKQSAQCAFPERFLYIKKKYPQLSFPEDNCVAFKEWKAAIAPKSISLVFSSAYANNPGSMFGHVLIKFNRYSPEIAHKDLLNYTASFGAAPDPNDNPIFYAFKGVFGGYRAYFTLQPYYVKTSEYNNSESRDLWDFEFKSEDLDIDKILNHLWELYGSSWFDYYFFDENCSLYVSKLLEIGLKKKKFKPYKFFTLPGDIINRFALEGDFIKKVHYRPSLKNQLTQKWNLHSSKRKKKILNAINSKKIPSKSSSKELDLIAQYIEYKNAETKNPQQMQQYENQVLQALSKQKETNTKVTFTPSDNRPDWGHFPSKLIFGLQQELDDFKIRFGYRGVLHDLYDFDKGYEPYNKIELLHFLGQYNTDNSKFELESITLIDVQSLPSFSKLFPKVSWSVGAQINKTYHLIKKDAHMLSLYAGAGLSKKWNNKSLLFALLEMRAEATTHNKNFFRLGPSLKIGLFHNFGLMKIGLETMGFIGLFEGDFKNNYYISNKFGLSFQLKKNLDLRAFLQQYGTYGKFKFGRPKMGLDLHYHF